MNGVVGQGAAEGSMCATRQEPKYVWGIGNEEKVVVMKKMCETGIYGGEK